MKLVTIIAQKSRKKKQYFWRQIKGIFIILIQAMDPAQQALFSDPERLANVAEEMSQKMIDEITRHQS